MSENKYHITYNSPALKERRKELRNKCTKEEGLLWHYLKNSNLGVKFIRQYSVGPYILDFYCPSKRLGIELDGKQHLSNREYDLERGRFLNGHDIKIIRFWNESITSDIQGSLNLIRSHILNDTPS